MEIVKNDATAQDIDAVDISFDFGNTNTNAAQDLILGFPDNDIQTSEESPINVSCISSETGHESSHNNLNDKQGPVFSSLFKDKENSEVDNSGITDLNVVTSNISESNFEENRGERNDEEIPICQSVDIGDVDSELNIHTASVESQSEDSIKLESEAKISDIDFSIDLSSEQELPKNDIIVESQPLNSEQEIPDTFNHVEKEEIVHPEDDVDEEHVQLSTLISVNKINQEDPGEFDFDIPTKIGEGTAKIPSEETKIPVKEELDNPDDFHTVIRDEKTNMDEKPTQDEITVTGGLIASDPSSNEMGKASPEIPESAAQAEWDAVKTITPGLSTDSTATGGGRSKPDESTSPIISYHECMDNLKASDWKKHRPSIKTCIPRRGFSAFKHALFGTKLHRQLFDERDFAFCIAHTQFNNEDEVHIRVLQTLYKKLTGSRFDCPRFGGHWEAIGFQGNDPSTDLRGTGFLGLLQLLFFVCDPRTAPMARDVYRLSLHETQNFPFCLMGINMTRLCLQSLREDHLNKECNKRVAVMAPLNDVYSGAYLTLYDTWKSQHKTIADSGFVLKDIENSMKKNTQAMIKSLDVHIERKQKAGISVEDEPLNFTNVCDDKAVN